jgi:D-tyrosyl-tRNA(Tyr) deacylase
MQNVEVIFIVLHSTFAVQMKIVLQRVSRASVTIENEVVGSIGLGYVLFVGFSPEDNERVVSEMVYKVVNLRVMSDEEGKMNKSILDMKGKILVVSQFTLYANTNKGRRPYFGDAAKPEVAEKLYDLFIEKLKTYDLSIESGEFGAMMQVELVNDGPVTILLEN